MSYKFCGYLFADRDEEGYLLRRGITFINNKSHTASPVVESSDFPGYCNMQRDVDGYMIRLKNPYTFEKD